MNANAGTGGNYDVHEDLSGSSYFSSASKPLLNNEEVSQNATYFQEAMAMQKQMQHPPTPATSLILATLDPLQRSRYGQQVSLQVPMLNPHGQMQQHTKPHMRPDNPNQICNPPVEEAAASSTESMKQPIISEDNADSDDEPSNCSSDNDS